VKICAFLIALSCVSPLAAQSGTSDAAARSNILALEYAWGQAETNGDIKALSGLFANSMVLADYDGTLLTKAEYLARVKSDAKSAGQVVTESMEVQVFRDSAIVIGIYHITGIGKAKPYLRRRRFIDTWLLLDGRWQCVAAAAIPIP
jgi:ketosteroid isomerase-like protein